MIYADNAATTRLDADAFKAANNTGMLHNRTSLPSRQKRQLLRLVR